VFMYTLNAKKFSWWQEITLIVWGPSARLQYGEALTLNLKIRGNANLNLLSRILDDKNDALKIYEYVKDTYEEIQGDTYQVERNYDIILIPKKSGTVHFAGIKIPYFHTGAKGYKYLEVPSFDIEVQGGPEINGEQADIKVVSLAKPSLKNTDPDSWQISLSPVLLLNLLALLLLIGGGIYTFKIYQPFKKTPIRLLKKLFKQYQKSPSMKEEQILHTMTEIALGIKLQSTGLSSLRHTDLPAALLDELLFCLSYLESRKFGVTETELDWPEKINVIYTGFLAFLQTKKTSHKNSLEEK
ncbi:MAG: hypothetical protein CVV50_06065, partial [Spirochaetae bacterium HGW-Spirochaetae-6]